MSTRTMLKGLLVAAGVAALAGTQAASAADDPLKIGFVYVSPIGDAGWTYQHELARQAIEEKFGDRIETTYVESVPEGADAERVIRQLATTGNGLIFTTSFGYMNPTVKVAPSFPDVTFEHATGYKTAENVGTYNARFYEGRYLAGLVAGAMTESNVLGYVSAFPIPEVVMGIDAYTLGARSVNPEAEVRVVWVNSWYDPGKERAAADTLISQGADVITQHTDSTAPVQAAEEAGVYSIGYHSDMSKYGPTGHLTAVTHIWDAYYTRVVESVMDDSWEPSNIWGGIADGMIELAPLNDAVPDDVAAMVEEKTRAIADGTFHPFQGPLKDQAGNVVVPEGEVMSDEDILRIDFYVEGIQGQLPQ